MNGFVFNFDVFGLSTFTFSGTSSLNHMQKYHSAPNLSKTYSRCCKNPFKIQRTKRMLRESAHGQHKGSKLATSGFPGPTCPWLGILCPPSTSHREHTQLKIWIIPDTGQACLGWNFSESTRPWSSTTISSLGSVEPFDFNYGGLLTNQKLLQKNLEEDSLSTSTFCIMPTMAWGIFAQQWVCPIKVCLVQFGEIWLSGYFKFNILR